MTQQMQVTRNPDGSHWPPYREDWSEQLQVEYAAGCVSADTGIRIEVRPAAARTPQKYYVRMDYERRSAGGMILTAQEVYVFLDGVRQAMTVIGAAPPLGAADTAV